jgi:hypothetical protein
MAELVFEQLISCILLSANFVTAFDEDGFDNDDNASSRIISIAVGSPNFDTSGASPFTAHPSSFPQR